MVRHFLGKHLRTFQKEHQTLERIVCDIREGNPYLRNRLITEYQPFIGKVVSKVCKKYIDPSRDDEFSIGLMAFDEAINHYTEEKGSSFLSFAELVIRRRIVDYVRKEARQRAVLTMDRTADDEEEREQSYAEAAASMQYYQLERETTYRREEIFHYRERLNEFGISIQTLPEETPKHVDARENAIAAARIMVRDPYLREFLLRKKKLPIKPLLQQVDVSRKTLERNRKYIIAVTLALIEDYQFLQEYLSVGSRSKGAESK